MLATSMTMEEIFCGTESIKQTMFEKVQLELNQFGFVVCNANVYQKMQQQIYISRWGSTQLHMIARASGQG